MPLGTYLDHFGTVFCHFGVGGILIPWPAPIYFTQLALEKAIRFCGTLSSAGGEKANVPLMWRNQSDLFHQIGPPKSICFNLCGSFRVLNSKMNCGIYDFHSCCPTISDSCPAQNEMLSVHWLISIKVVINGIVQPTLDLLR